MRRRRINNLSLLRGRRRRFTHANVKWEIFGRELVLIGKRHNQSNELSCMVKLLFACRVIGNEISHFWYCARLLPDGHDFFQGQLNSKCSARDNCQVAFLKPSSVHNLELFSSFPAAVYEQIKTSHELSYYPSRGPWFSVWAARNKNTCEIEQSQLN